MKKVKNPEPMKLKKPVKIKDKRPKKKYFKHKENHEADRINYDPEEYDDFSHYYETNE